jgi:lipopolysaccharide/colanic/teichoic acid biosynthesis glycosyltransferase
VGTDAERELRASAARNTSRSPRSIRVLLLRLTRPDGADIDAHYSRRLADDARLLGYSVTEHKFSPGKISDWPASCARLFRALRRDPVDVLNVDAPPGRSTRPIEWIARLAGVPVFSAATRLPSAGAGQASKASSADLAEVATAGRGSEQLAPDVGPRRTIAFVGSVHSPELLELIAAVRLLDDPTIHLHIHSPKPELSPALPRSGLERRITFACGPAEKSVLKADLVICAAPTAARGPTTKPHLVLRQLGVEVANGAELRIASARGPRALARLLSSLLAKGTDAARPGPNVARSSELALANWAEALSHAGVTAGDTDAIGLAPRRRLARPRTFYARHGKRWFDLAVTVPLAVALSPVIAMTLASVAATLGRPTVFRQLRPGLGGRVFSILKLRTMTDATDAAGQLLPDDQRLTRFGRFLRSASLDELPSVWNVIRGDMSLVGPRPLLVQYLNRYDARQATRHDVRPGITGWAQVSGRNLLSWEAKFEADAWYVENLSLALDLRILLKTVRAVLFKEGISADGHVTMPEFRGNESGTPA